MKNPKWSERPTFLLTTITTGVVLLAIRKFVGMDAVIITSASVITGMLFRLVTRKSRTIA